MALFAWNPRSCLNRAPEGPGNSPMHAPYELLRTPASKAAMDRRQMSVIWGWWRWAKSSGGAWDFRD